MNGVINCIHKQGKNKKTVLRQNEIDDILDVFINKLAREKFSVKVPFDEICQRKYSWSPGQYFEHKLEFLQLSKEEFKQKISEDADTLSIDFQKTARLGDDILDLLKKIDYDEQFDKCCTKAIYVCRKPCATV